MVLVILSAILLTTTSALAASASYCQDLAIGESFTINESGTDDLTSLGQHYSLKRESENEYVAYLNVQYVPKGRIKGSQQVVDDFEKKVDDCFEESAKKLTDEMGITIRLKRFQEEHQAKVPKPHKVRVYLHEKYERQNSKNYSLDISCPTIIHESLHLLGLVDEYTEHETIAVNLNPNPILRIFKPFVQNPLKKIAYDCRATSVLNSVMSNEKLTFLVEEKVLYSAQASAIIYPNCQAKNKNYYDCSRLAYLTSKNDDPVTGCGEIPSICRTPNWLLKTESPIWEIADFQNTSNRITELNLFNRPIPQLSKSKMTHDEVTKQ